MKSLAFVKVNYGVAQFVDGQWLQSQVREPIPENKDGRHTVGHKGRYIHLKFNRKQQLNEEKYGKGGKMPN